MIFKSLVRINLSTNFHANINNVYHVSFKVKLRFSDIYNFNFFI
jgi:hypothetical protein